MSRRSDAPARRVSRGREYWELQLRGGAIALVVVGAALVALAFATPLGRVFVKAGGSAVLVVLGVVLYAVSVFVEWRRGE